MRKAIALIAFLLVVIGGSIWFYLTPQLALRNMRDAAYAKNAGELSGYVDFPSVRDSLKVAVGSKVTALAKDQTNPILALGAQIAGNLVDPMIDTLVTPDNMALMLSGVPPAVIGTTNVGSAVGAVETTSHYDGFNGYVVSVTRKDSAWPPVELELRRDGFASWKLSAIRLP
jgi:hypothetical protein